MSGHPATDWVIVGPPGTYGRLDDVLEEAGAVESLIERVKEIVGRK